MASLDMGKDLKSPNEWRSRFLILVLVIGFVISYYPVWKSLISAWSNSEEYSHGYFIVPIVLYIVWLKRKILSKIPIKSSKWGLAITIFSLVLYIFSQLAGIITVASFTLVLTISGMIFYFFGYNVFKELRFPLFILLFMIPIPAQVYSAVTVPLQLFVSKTSVWIASLFGMTIYREGNVIYLPQRTLQVVQACSGLRSLITLLTLSLIFGYLTLKSDILRTILFFCGVPVAIFVNIIRVLLIVSAFYYLNVDLTAGIIHSILGIGIFFLALFIIYLAKEALAIWENRIISE